MFAPGDNEFAGSAVDYRAGLGSAELSALTSALSGLVAASDGMADAVTRHDRIALTTCNERAEALVEEVNRLRAALSNEDRAHLGDVGVRDLYERLDACARRNAYLIEHAWATDAALMRLLLGLGKVAADGSVGGYSANPGPSYVDREA
jgi:hypothetical protein